MKIADLWCTQLIAGCGLAISTVDNTTVPPWRGGNYASATELHLDNMQAQFSKFLASGVVEELSDPALIANLVGNPVGAADKKDNGVVLAEKRWYLDLSRHVNAFLPHYEMRLPGYDDAQPARAKLLHGEDRSLCCLLARSHSPALASLTWILVEWQILSVLSYDLWSHTRARRLSSRSASATSSTRSASSSLFTSTTFSSSQTRRRSARSSSTTCYASSRRSASRSTLLSSFRQRKSVTGSAWTSTRSRDPRPGPALQARAHQDQTARLLRAIRRARLCRPRRLLSLVGRLSHVSRAVRSSRTFLRRMWDTTRALPRRVPHTFRVVLNRAFWEDFEWWEAFLIRWNGVSCWTQPVDSFMFSDACLTGFGFHCGSDFRFGAWPADLHREHINWLKLRAP